MRPPVVLCAVVSLAAVAMASPPAAGLAHPPSAAERAATLDRTPPNATVVGLYRARGGFGDELGSVTAIERARQRGTVTSAEVVVPGDLLLVELRSRALVTALRARPEATPTRRFFGLLNDTSATLTLVQVNPPPQQLRKVIDPGPASTRIVTANATTYALVDTDAVRVRWIGAAAHGDRPELVPGAVFAAQFTTTDDATADAVVDAPRIAVTAPTVTLANQELTRRASTPRLDATGGRLAVRSTAAPGSRVSVRLTDATGATLLTETARLGPDGRATVAVPNRTVAPNETLTAHLALAGADGDPRRVRLRAVRPTATLGNGTLGRAATVTPGVAVRFNETRLSLGGFLVVTGPDGRVRNATRVTPEDRLVGIDVPTADGLAPGATLTVTAYRDTNGNGQFDDGDEPYRANGTAVRTTVTYRPPSTPTPRPSPSATVTPPQSPTRTPGQPGLGGVAALAALALLAAARRR